jgi:F0F1-type ATP synthase membrane subunit a
VGKLLSNRRAVLVTLIAVIVISFLGGAVGAAFGFGYFGGPIPFIQLPAEVITTIGGFELMNTYVMFWLAILVLLVLTFFATRKIKEVPGRMQGLFEAFFEFFTNLAESSAGGRKGRMFLPVVTGIFLVVLFSNWLGTLPGVGTIGRIESVEEYIHHRLEDTLKDQEDGEEALHLLEEEGMAAFASVEFLEAHPEEAEVFGEALATTLREHAEDKFVVFSGDSGVGTIPLGHGEDFKVALSQVVAIPAEGEHLDNEHIAEAVHQIEHPELLEGVEHEELSHEDVASSRVGLLVPYFRGASTDLNTTLAIAIFAMVSVQFWGFRTLGFKGYAGKFFINPLKRSLVDTFVGILELLGEFIKIISFTFRLFGNMFAGEILLIAMGFLFPLIGMIPFLGLELFVGVIQAVIFSVLTLIFGSLAIMSHEHHEDEHTEEAHH